MTDDKLIEEVALKECPFCGSVAAKDKALHKRDYVRIVCTQCPARIEADELDDDVNDVAKLWNTRATAHDAQLTGTLPDNYRLEKSSHQLKVTISNEAVEGTDTIFDDATNNNSLPAGNDINVATIETAELEKRVAVMTRCMAAIYLEVPENVADHINEAWREVKEGYETTLRASEQKRRELEEAAKSLLDLREHKRLHGADYHYISSKEAAWGRLEAVLSPTQPAGAGDE